jgi:hypothetical protein
MFCKEANMTESPDRTVFKRGMFWTAYILGTLTMFFSFLLAQVPRGRNVDFTLDYVCWSLAASFLVGSLVAAKFTWSSWNPLKTREASIFSQMFIGVAWIELAISIYGILSFATDL